MATGDERIYGYSKQVLGAYGLSTKVIQYLLNAGRKTFSKLLGDKNVLLAPVVLSGTAGGFSCGAQPKGITETGELLLPADGYTAVPFENTNTTTYHIAMTFCEVPANVEVNPRTGAYQYGSVVEAVGRVAAPVSVTDNGDGTLTFSLASDALTEVGHSYAGRTAKVWLVAPKSLDDAVAFETRTIAFTGGANKITTVGKLGQTNASTTASAYRVQVKGLRVSTTNLSAVAGHVYLGTVTGVGGNGTPTVFNLSGQVIVPAGGDMIKLVEYDEHLQPKIRVKGDASDSATSQIAVVDSSSRRTFKVDEKGALSAGHADFTDSPAIEITGAGGTSTIRQVGAHLKFDDPTSTSAIPLTNTVTGLAIDSDLDQSLVGGINGAYAKAVASFDATFDSFWISGAACTDGGGLDLAVASGSYMVNGKIATIAGATVAITNNATRYVYLDTSDSTYKIETAITATTAVWIAKVVTSGGAIASIVSLKQFVGKTPFQTGDILVGGSGSTFGCHFETVYAAVQFVKAHMVSAKRAWRVLVVDKTTETETTVVDFPGLTIEGFAATDSEIHFQATDGSPKPLFKLVAVDGFTLQNVKITSNVSTPDGTGARPVILLDGLSTNVLIDNVVEKAFGTTGPHFLIDSIDGSAGLVRSTLRSIKSIGCTDGALYIANATKLVVDGCHFDNGSAHQNSAYHGFKFEAGNDIYVHNCTFAGWEGSGVHIEGATYVKLAECVVRTPGLKGVNIVGGAKYVTVANVSCIDCGASEATEAQGICVNAGADTYSHILGCFTSLDAGGPGGFGIAIKTGSNKNIVIGNQTNSFGVEEADAGQNTFANNRDDA